MVHIFRCACARILRCIDAVVLRIESSEHYIALLWVLFATVAVFLVSKDIFPVWRTQAPGKHVLWHSCHRVVPYSCGGHLLIRDRHRQCHLDASVLNVSLRFMVNNRVCSESFRS